LKRDDDDDDVENGREEEGIVSRIVLCNIDTETGVGVDDRLSMNLHRMQGVLIKYW
jgi:hypothetical protein